MKQPVEFQKFFDHTLLKPDATREEILKLCRDAAQYDFASVCVNGCHVRFAVDKLKDTSVKVAAVTGFPLGAMSTKTKSFETKNALENGASEIDTVINIGALKDGRFDYIQQELIILSTRLCHRNRAILKSHFGNRAPQPKRKYAPHAFWQSAPVLTSSKHRQDSTDPAQQ